MAWRPGDDGPELPPAHSQLEVLWDGPMGVATLWKEISSIHLFAREMVVVLGDFSGSLVDLPGLAGDSFVVRNAK